MPPIKKVTKSCCPLCEELAELKFRYDICEECHQDLNSKDTDASEGDDLDHTSDDESDMGDPPSPVEDGVMDDEKHVSIVDSKSDSKEKDVEVKDSPKENSNSDCPKLVPSFSRSDNNTQYLTQRPTLNASTLPQNKQIQRTQAGTIPSRGH